MGQVNATTLQLKSINKLSHETTPPVVASSIWQFGRAILVVAKLNSEQHIESNEEITGYSLMSFSCSVAECHMFALDIGTEVLWQPSPITRVD